MKLTRVQFLGGNPPLHGFRELGQGHYEGWSAHVRGASVLLVSPPGWRLGELPHGDARVCVELPRNQFLLSWSLDDGDEIAAPGSWSPGVAREPIDATARKERR